MDIVNMQSRNAFFTEEQEDLILKLLHKSGRISVAEITSHLNISASTARIRLNSLNQKGLLVRTHGGAISKDSAENSIVHFGDFWAEKRAVASAAIQHIQDGDLIAIGAGTTMLELAKQLHHFSSLTVVTSSVLVAHELAYDSNIDVKICGGSVRPRTGSCFGSQSEEFFKSLYIPKCFFSFDSISLERGFTTLDVDTRTDIALINCAQKKYALADSSKTLRGPYFEQIAPLESVELLFLDAGVDVEFVRQLRLKGLDVNVCEVP